jgi:hypothetical protein
VKISELPFGTPSFAFEHLEHGNLIGAQGVPLNRPQMLRLETALRLVHRGFELLRGGDFHTNNLAQKPRISIKIGQKDKARIAQTA